jgi:hypothetical protein
LNLFTDPWIPTRDGPRSLQAMTREDAPPLAAPSAPAHAALTRLLIAVRGQGSPDPAHFNLFGDRPFLQLPPNVTASLKRQPLSVLQLHRASGRGPTMLGLGTDPSLDDAPRPATPAEAATDLITFLQFTPSNGKSTWAHTLDAPLARAACFLAEGPTLADTLALNTPDTPPSVPPIWAQAPDWDTWRTGQGAPLTPWTALAFPWLTVTLDDADPALVRHTRLAGGAAPRGDLLHPEARDPHTLHVLKDSTKPYDEKKNPFVTLKNPADHCAERLLATALLAALSPDAPGVILPVGLRRARAGTPTRRIRVTVNVTRTGQPVLLDTLEATLPWPDTDQQDAARTALAAALHIGEQLRGALVRTYLPTTTSKRAGELAHATLAVRAYWQALWPDLTQVLAGRNAEFPDPLPVARRLLSDHTRAALGPAAQTGARIAHGYLKATQVAEVAGPPLDPNDPPPAKNAPANPRKSRAKAPS